MQYGNWCRCGFDHGKKIFGACERLRDAGADIPRADMLFEIGLAHQACGLLARAAKDQAPARFPDDIGELLESGQAGGVNGGHVAQP